MIFLPKEKLFVFAVKNLTQNCKVLSYEDGHKHPQTAQSKTFIKVFLQNDSNFFFKIHFHLLFDLHVELYSSLT